MTRILLILAGLGVIFFSLGLHFKIRWHRWSGLGLLTLALLSLIPLAWSLSNLSFTTAFFFVGLAFVGIGFLYSKYKEHIKDIL
jgi:hypothetical protein